MKLRAALDLSPLHRPFPTSVVRTVRPLVEALHARDDVEVIGVAPPANGSLALWRQTALVAEARRARADALHSFTSAFPLSRRLPVVQTVHEAPWRRAERENAGMVHRAWARLGRARAAATCTPSPGVARDLGDHPRLHVVPWGVDERFGPVRDGLDARLGRELPGLPPEPFVLVLGGTRAKKRLALACEAAARAGLPVVATGPPEDGASALAERHGALVLTGEIDGALLPALVRAAGCVAVLSTSEGFSLPVVEALRSRRAVVTPSGTVQSETAGGAAFDVDPRDPDDVARGLRDAVAASEERLDRGQRVAGGYSWERTAERLVDVWRGLR
ncbi:MAG: glycosyltransferase [Planctomycetota bacterium]